MLVACPDARPPAYQAVIGLDRAGLLDRFVTAFYYDPDGRLATLARRHAPGRFARSRGCLLRRHDPEIPAAASRPSPLRPGLAARGPARREPAATLKRVLARSRTEWFDRRLAGSWSVAAPARSWSSATSARARRSRSAAARDPDDPEHGPRRRPRGGRGPRPRGRGRRPTSSRSTWATARSTATSWTGCTSGGSATSRWPTASSSPRSTSPRRSSRTGRPASGSA